MGRNPREIHVNVVPADISPEEAFERLRRATEILLRIQERVDRRKTTLELDAIENRSDNSRSELQIDPAPLLRDFFQVAALADVPISEEDITFELSHAPHQRPKRLPPGKSAVYVFCTRFRCLEVGKVSAQSSARFTSHHYNPGSSRSNLSKSLLAY